MSEFTHSMLMTARRRLATARRNKTRADNFEARVSGQGPAAMSIAARKVADADAALAAATEHYAIQLAEVRRHAA